MTERDTHFAGFAKLLHEELATFPYIPLEGKGYSERMRQLIAQRAYDLVFHILENIDFDLWYGSPNRDDLLSLIAGIDDLTAWPEQS